MIRPIEERDISKCLEIYNYYVKNTTATFECSEIFFDDFKSRVNRIIQKFPYFVCEIDNAIVGYAYLDYFIEREAAFMSADLSIYVDHSQRGKEIGRLLLANIIKAASSYGIKNIISVVTTNNISSIRFHEQNKFSKEGIINNIAYKLGEKLGVIYYKLELWKDVAGVI